MIFVYSQWEKFCKQLNAKGIRCVTACDVLKKRTGSPYIILKHDVETDVARAYKMAEIESVCGHRGSYYVQAYLLDDEKNVRLLREMQEMGHEISYHYDVMDSNQGNLERAIEEFEKNKKTFEQCGFQISTVCQHGNPVVERIGYHSNRDFFRSSSVQKLYPQVADIMVDFKIKAETEYLYFSDAGHQFRLIYDPINNDVVKSSNQDIICEDLGAVLNMISATGNGIVSVHPHRWTSTALVYYTKIFLFKTVRFVAKKLMKIPAVRKVMEKYYYLAKKI